MDKDRWKASTTTPIEDFKSGIKALEESNKAHPPIIMGPELFERLKKEHPEAIKD